MRTSKEESLGIALALDTAIVVLEGTSTPLPRRHIEQSLMVMRDLRTHALRDNRNETEKEPDDGSK